MWFEVTGVRLLEYWVGMEVTKVAGMSRTRELYSKTFWNKDIGIT